MRGKVLAWLVLSLGLAVAPAYAQVQTGFIANSETVGAANTAVAPVMNGSTGERGHLYSIDARCSAGTSNVTVTSGGINLFTTTAAEVTTSRLRLQWPMGLTGSYGSNLVVTLAACGVGNTGTLAVQMDRY